MIYPGEGKKGQPKAGDYVLAAERMRAETAASPHQSTTAFDLARADKWEGQARTKQLPSTRTEIGARRKLREPPHPVTEQDCAVCGGDLYRCFPLRCPLKSVPNSLARNKEEERLH